MASLSIEWPWNIGAMILIATILCGCSQKPQRILQANIDSQAVAERLMQDLDQDGSGALSAKEATSLRAIADHFGRYDSDSNSELTPEEIADRLETIVFDPNKALLPATCVVLRSRKPIAGADVRLIPLSYFEGKIPPAHGVSDSHGAVAPSIEPNDLPDNAPSVPGLIRPGLYRVEVTHPSVSISPKFNTESTLSVEISSASLATGSIPLNVGP